MKNKKFIRLNINDNFLSLGNFFRIIKEESVNSTFLQTNLFEIIFNVDDIADSTVNNYCTGLRAINIKYRNYFENLKNDFLNDESIFIPTIVNILNLINNSNIDFYETTLTQINSNSNLKHICNRLYSISKNDHDVTIQLSNKLYKYLSQNDLYNFIVHVLFYIILEKKQPIYTDNKINEIVEKNIYNTNISINDIQEFIKVQLNSGILSLRILKELAQNNNPFASFELASMEYYGIISGKPRYEKAYEYYVNAAKYNHPVANWAIGYLYYTGHIGSRSKRDLLLAFKYFNKSRKLECSNAYNSLGLMILNNNITHIKDKKNTAIKMFEKAVEFGNIYAYNNLGKIYEQEKDYKKAFEYYIFSANAGDSWASNKIGEFYRKGIYLKKDLTKAFEYYNQSSDSPIFTLCPWSKYNLAKYFYKNGNLEASIEKNLNYAIELLTDIEDEIFAASEELLYIYYELYLTSNDTLFMNKVNFYKSKCEKHKEYTKKIKQNIEKNLQSLKKYNEEIVIP